ncbi:MAG TPA: type II secretion system protein M [Candidatus Competibacter sp.]|nr:type II secretion system protein M [Candidatus Competibacteraceae bacterium]HRE54559.1 type II secretion system protein M [Candidatus Competibacter sp.]HUM95033.1 type II secretion system protein M [Candidatus Competibacter sp.]
MKAWWDGISNRERALVAGGALSMLLLLFYLAIWQPFQANHRRLRQNVAEQRADLAWMRQAAAEVKRLNAAAARPADNRSLLTLVDQTARAAGLGAALKRVAPQGDDKLSAQLDAVEFDKLVPWLGVLEHDHRVSLVSFSADRTETPGLVNARIVLGGRP